MTHLIGTRVGHYRVIVLLGEGGMGQVYVGYDEKLNRKVALKSIRADHRMNAESKARFLREARVLSQLAHPNICRIFDYIEGEKADFLVLELIHGQRLTEAIKRGMDHRQKLRIAGEIAGVLVSAHGKGIIHRDLKPDNVMLDETGQVKVLDFGLSRLEPDGPTVALAVSKAGTPPLFEATELETGNTLDVADAQTTPLRSDFLSAASDAWTRLGTIMGTLGYMSPEQARGEPASTASDLYSFGLMLQELFAGKSPYDPTIDPTARLEKVRTGETLPVEGLDADLAALIERLKSPSPAARPTAMDASERLAWIRNKPVRRRKKFLLAAAMAVLAFFGAAMTFQTLRAVRAERTAREEAATSKQVSEFLVGLFQVSDPSEAQGNTITAREILDKGARKIETELEDQPEVQARLMEVMGNTYRGLGLYAEGQPLMENSLRIREKIIGEEHPDTARNLCGLAMLLYRQGKYAEAEPLYRRALAIEEKVFGPMHPNTASLLNNLAMLYYDQGKYAEAEPIYRRALAIDEQALGPEHPNTAMDLNNLAYLYYHQGKYKEAESLYIRALGIRERVLGSEHPDTAMSLHHLGMLYRAQGRYAEAEPMDQRALRIREKVLGPDHPGTALSLNNLAALYRAQHKYAEAEPLYQRVLAIREKVLGPEHPDVARSLHILGRLYREENKFEESEDAFKRALAIYDKTTQANPQRIVETLSEYATLLRMTSRAAEAEKLEVRAKAINEKQGQEKKK
jgi:tetratricopeptide (TPR) repeat protein